MESLHLTQSQIAVLEQHGCSADQWEAVTVSPQTNVERIRDTHFKGTVHLGDNTGTVTIDGMEFDSGITRAVIADCRIGSGVRIANIGSIIAGYDIGDNVVIQNTAALLAGAGAACGNGIELDAVNEGGGRGTLMYDGLSAQTAYLQAMLRHDPAFTTNLSSLILTKIEASKQADTARGMCIGASARIMHCGEIRNVAIGAHAFLHGVQALENGTILSCVEDPTEVGEGVQARSFIIAEGAKVGSGAILDKVFVGQAVKMGKQFSAENSLFFANCEGYHGEAVSLFAGPYTVTHHKSSLLIAGLFSFYNAGSGTNQSNHMYKLGPVHQGVFERGCKSGSFSYVLLESRIGAFSVLIGKHMTNINTPNLPFSYIYEDEGASKLIPGMSLFSVGTARDSEKWPKRDDRRAPVKRDLICFDVFSPYTVEKMRRGRDELLALSESTSKEKHFVNYGGVQIARLLLRKGAKYYSSAIARYLNDKVCTRLAQALAVSGDWASALASLAPGAALQRPEEWTDVCGLLAPRERLTALEAKISAHACSSIDEVDAELRAMADAYESDEWSYVCDAFSREYGTVPAALTREQALAAVEEWKRSASSLHAMILEDSKREFAAFAKIGYGLDHSDTEREADFTAVRGSSDTNGVVQKLVKEEQQIEVRYQHFTSLIVTNREG
jgi:hypothetical protein